MRRLLAAVLVGATMAGCAGGGHQAEPPASPAGSTTSVSATSARHAPCVTNDPFCDLHATCGSLGATLASSLSLSRPTDGDEPAFTNEDAPLFRVLPGSGRASSGHDPVVRQAGCKFSFQRAGGKTGVQLLFLRPASSPEEFGDLLIGGEKSDGMNELGGVGKRASFLGNPDGEDPYAELHVLVADAFGFVVQVNEAHGTKGDLTTPGGIVRLARTVVGSVPSS